MVLPAESKSASMRNGVSRLEYITNPEPLQIGNDFQTRIFKEFLHMFSRESRALARVLPLGEGAAKRRVRVNRVHSYRPSPGLRPPSPRGSQRERSKLQLQGELNLSRGRGGRCNDPARGAVIGALENNFIRIAEVRVIQNIESLGAELQIQSLTDSHSL